jgi:hypothetical protein
MSGNLSSLLLFRLGSLLDHIGRWWNNASAYDFGTLALAVIVCVWFLSRYYSD